jgi:hypothetical protein
MVTGVGERYGSVKFNLNKSTAKILRLEYDEVLVGTNNTLNGHPKAVAIFFLSFLLKKDPGFRKDVLNLLDGVKHE